jgi:hypothetical protein
MLVQLFLHWTILTKSIVWSEIHLNVTWTSILNSAENFSVYFQQQMLSKTVKCLILDIQTNRKHDVELMPLYYALRQKTHEDNEL